MDDTTDNVYRTLADLLDTPHLPPSPLPVPPHRVIHQPDIPVSRASVSSSAQRSGDAIVHTTAAVTDHSTKPPPLAHVTQAVHELEDELRDIKAAYIDTAAATVAGIPIPPAHTASPLSSQREVPSPYAIDTTSQASTEPIIHTSDVVRRLTATSTPIALPASTITRHAPPMRPSVTHPLRGYSATRHIVPYKTISTYKRSDITSHNILDDRTATATTTDNDYRQRLPGV